MAAVTSNVMRGEMVKGPSVTHSSNMRLYRPSLLRMRSQVAHVSGSSSGGSR